MTIVDNITDVLQAEIVDDDEITKTATKLGKLIDAKAEKIFARFKGKINPLDFYKLLNYIEDTVVATHTWTEGIQHFAIRHENDVGNKISIDELLNGLSSEVNVSSVAANLGSILFKRCEEIYQQVKDTIHYEDFFNMLVGETDFITIKFVHEAIKQFYHEHLHEDPAIELDEDGDMIY